MTHLSHDRFMKLWKMKPMASSDCVVIDNDRILLVKRATEPFNGYWCLPGGIMDNGESIEQTAMREVKEETGVKAKIVSLLGVYSKPGRDPRGTSVSVVFLMKPLKFTGKHDKEVSDVKFFPINKIPNLGFDHNRIVSDALKLLRKKK